MLNNAVRLDGQTFACAAVSRKQIFTDMGSQTDKLQCDTAGNKSALRRP